MGGPDQEADDVVAVEDVGDEEDMEPEPVGVVPGDKDDVVEKVGDTEPLGFAVDVGEEEPLGLVVPVGD